MLREFPSSVCQGASLPKQTAIKVAEAVTESYEALSDISGEPTVLLVDDDPDSLVLLENILDQFCCQVICQSCGQAALAYAQQTPPALILLVIWLSDMSGLEIIQSLRHNQATQMVPIAAVTALASHRDRDTILQSGCNHYIAKPYLLEDMEAVLQQYLRLRDA